MLVEDMRCLDAGAEAFISLNTASSIEHEHSWRPFCKSKFPEWWKKGRWHLHIWWIVLQERKSEFKEPESFTPEGGRGTIYLYLPMLSATKYRLEKIFWKNCTQCFYLQDVQKLINSIEDSLPIFAISDWLM